MVIFCKLFRMLPDCRLPDHGIFNNTLNDLPDREFLKYIWKKFPDRGFLKCPVKELPDRGLLARSHFKNIFKTFQDFGY